VLEDKQKDRTLHLSELGVIGSLFHHGHSGVVGIFQVPFPGMVVHQALMVSGQTVEYPMGRGHMGIVVGPAGTVGMLMVPGRPSIEIDILAIGSFGKGIRLIVEHALFDPIFMGPLIVLYAPP